MSVRFKMMIYLFWD